ncbi:hypothetical protein ACT3SZ_16030 [Corynebacterium sp. AOP40-9SA-29]|uniref:hypothetical protein n=1 Tax=Corynebacterium sp. AOP40-9SA-29 TaxID=3457677 RepID=UPI004034E5B5
MFLALGAGIALAVVTVVTYTDVLPGAAVLSQIFGLTWLWSWWGYLVVRLVDRQSRPLAAAVLGAASTGIAGAAYYPVQLALGTREDFPVEPLVFWTVTGVAVGCVTGLCAGLQRSPRPLAAVGAVGVVLVSSFGLWITAPGLIGPASIETPPEKIVALVVMIILHVLLVLWVLAGLLRRSPAERELDPLSA